MITEHGYNSGCNNPTYNEHKMWVHVIHGKTWYPFLKYIEKGNLEILNHVFDRSLNDEKWEDLAKNRALGAH